MSNITNSLQVENDIHQNDAPPLNPTIFPVADADELSGEQTACPTSCQNSETSERTIAEDVDDADVVTGTNDVWDEGGYRYIREKERIWVEFSSKSLVDPYSFSPGRKWFITLVAQAFTLITSFNASAYAIGEGTMERDLNTSTLAAASGLGVYAWGFAIFPLFLAPFSEEFGRKPMYIAASLVFWLFYFPIAKADTIGLVIAFRLLQGGAGSVGATVVGGSLADIWVSAERGPKMGGFALCAVVGTSFAPVVMAWVEARPSLEWRWIQWIQIIIVGSYLPFVLLMPETRGAVILRNQAAKMRAKASGGGSDLDEKTSGATYWARAEVGKPSLLQMIKTSLSRPLYMLATEPIIIFFTLWISVAWGVLYGITQSINYVFTTTYGFTVGQVGLVFLSMTIGTVVSFFLNTIQERLYKQNVAKKGPEARLYAPMIAGICFASGCFIYAWTTFPRIHWIAPCIGIAVTLLGIYAIYLACFNYLADAYTLYASSALAGQSFVRNMVGGSFPFFASPLYRNLGPNWASTIFGCIAALLAVVPFVAFFYGPRIRAGSKFAKTLAAEEARIAKEREEREKTMGGTTRTV